MGAYDAVALSGDERGQALYEIAAQMRAWGLTMPPGEPLPLHFGLRRFTEIGETEFWIANEIDSGYCGKFLFVFDGQTCPYHYHGIKHETFFVVKGRVRLRVGADTRELAEGDLLAMPPGVGHSFTGLGPALLLEVSTSSLPGDNYFENPNIGAI